MINAALVYQTGAEWLEWEGKRTVRFGGHTPGNRPLNGYPKWIDIFASLEPSVSCCLCADAKSVNFAS